MPDLSRFAKVNAARRQIWTADGEMDRGLANATPCLDKERLFDSAHTSFVARWAARTICDTCPLSGDQGICLRAGIGGREVGVWGGHHSNDGEIWHPVQPMQQSDVLEALLQAVDGKRGVAMIRSINHLVPGMRALFLDERGRMKYQTIRGQQCIIRDARRSDLPNGEYGSIRLYIMIDLLGVSTDDSQLVVHATCSTGGCIAPWHLRWARAPQGMPRSIALGMYAYFSKGWKIAQASEVSGIIPRELRRYTTLATLFRSAEALPEPSIGTMSRDFELLSNRAPTQREEDALIRFCVAADDLDCNTVPDLISVGESEF